MILHLITDRRRLAGRETSWDAQRRCLLRQVQFAAEAGVAVVQLREPDLDTRRVWALAQDMVGLVAGSRTRIVVNDRLDVALAAGAHGVHLRGDSMAPAVVRRLVPPAFLVGFSVHDADDVAAGEAADYLIAGTVWATPSKLASHRLLGLDGLRRVVCATRVPVLAIGGVTEARLTDVSGTGAAGAAAIGMFIGERTAADTRGECGARPLHDLARIASRHHAASDQRAS